VGAITWQGIGKRVPVRGFPVQNRGGQGRVGIRLNPDDSLAAVHVVRALKPVVIVVFRAAAFAHA